MKTRARKHLHGRFRPWSYNFGGWKYQQYIQKIKNTQDRQGDNDAWHRQESMS